MMPKRLINTPEGQTVEEFDASERDWVEPIDWYTQIAATRYAHEVSGTTFTHSNGNTYGVGTDRQSQALVTGAAVQAQRNGISKQWKTSEGFVTLTADDILAMGDAVDAHVQSCFDREAELVAKVADGSITESDLETGWP